MSPSRHLLSAAAAALVLHAALHLCAAQQPADRPAPRPDRNSMLAHEQLLEKRKKGRIDVYFLGDSITRRWGTSDGQYAAFLANWRENFHGWNAANFGWGGDTTQNILWRLRNGELDGVNPKVIVLMAGTNNVGRESARGGDDPRVADVTRGIKAVLDLCRRKAPRATVVLMGITPRNDNPAVMPVINKINENISKFADGKRIRYVNINDRLADGDGRLLEGVSGDGLHLEVRGYQVWADALRPILTELLGPPGREDHAPPPTGDPSAAESPLRLSGAQGRGRWRLVWADEFDYAGLPDPAKWGYDVGGHGWGNQELQFYTERRRENARVEGGRLVIEARRENWEGREYTSARLVSKGKGDWTYGRFEVSAKLPTGRGTWPAIWMLPTRRSYGGAYWPDNGEIDIMEHVGFDPDVVHASVHTKAYYHSIGTQKTAKLNVPTARSAFNVYAVEWTPEEVRAYINGQHYFTFRNERLTNPQADYRQWPFDKPFHLLLNVAVGGGWGGAKGVDESIWPQRMEVEYVRVYRAAP